MSILEALNPLLLVLQFLALNPVSFDQKYQNLQKSKPLFWYSVASILISFGFFLYGFFIENSDFLLSESNNEVAESVDVIQLIGIRVAHLFILLESLMKRDDFIKLLNRFEEWDSTFMYHLNTSINHKLTKKLIIFKLFGATGFYVGIQMILLLTLVLRKEYSFMSYWISYVIPFLVCCFRYFQMYLIAWLIKNRFHMINSKLSVIALSTSQTHVGGGRKVGGAIVGNYKGYQELNRIKALYDVLWEITQLANKCFGLSFLVIIGNDFVGITGHCYWIFLTLKDSPRTYLEILAVMGSLIWTIPFFVNVISICSICHETSNAANDTGPLVHKINYDKLDETQIHFIEQFSLQLLHQRIHFTAFGFFNVDFSLLFTMAAATTTYLVILFQFHLTEL